MTWRSDVSGLSPQQRRQQTTHCSRSDKNSEWKCFSVAVSAAAASRSASSLPRHVRGRRALEPLARRSREIWSRPPRSKQPSAQRISELSRPRIARRRAARYAARPTTARTEPAGTRWRRSHILASERPTSPSSSASFPATPGGITVTAAAASLKVSFRPRLCACGTYVRTADACKTPHRRACFPWLRAICSAAVQSSSRRRQRRIRWHSPITSRPRVRLFSPTSRTSSSPASPSACPAVGTARWSFTSARSGGSTSFAISPSSTASLAFPAARSLPACSA